MHHYKCKSKEKFRHVKKRKREHFVEPTVNIKFKKRKPYYTNLIPTTLHHGLIWNNKNIETNARELTISHPQASFSYTPRASPNISLQILAPNHVRKTKGKENNIPLSNPTTTMWPMDENLPKHLFCEISTPHTLFPPLQSLQCVWFGTTIGLLHMNGER